MPADCSAPSKVEERALLGVIGAGWIAWRRANSSIFFVDQLFIGELLLAAIAPLLADLFVQALGEGLGQPIGQSFDQDRVVIVMIGHELGDELVNAVACRDGEGAEIILPAAVDRSDKISQSMKRRLAATFPLLPERVEPAQLCAALHDDAFLLQPVAVRGARRGAGSRAGRRDARRAVRPRTTASASFAPRVAIRRSAVMILQGLPIAILLFVLFPRLAQPLWGLPSDHSAKTGLSDSMSPGEISELSLSDAVAFRVEFDGPVPPNRDRYWRGPVFSRFDGTQVDRVGDRDDEQCRARDRTIDRIHRHDRAQQPAMALRARPAFVLAEAGRATCRNQRATRRASRATSRS